MNRILKILIFVFLFFFCACASAPELRYPPNRWIRDSDKKPIVRPRVNVAQKHGADEEGEYFSQIEQMMNMTENLSSMVQMAAVGGTKEALNTNNFGEVADSTWFTNTIGRFDITPDEIARIGAAAGPDSKGDWKIVHVNAANKPVSITVTDNSSNIYTLKFGEPESREYAAGSDLIAQRFLRLAGYNVPDGAVVDFNPSILKMDKDSMLKRRSGDEIKMTSADLADVLEQIGADRSGNIRAIAYKWPNEDMLGPFSFHGERRGDANDRIPHEHRRELRGYRVFCEFLGRAAPENTLTFDSFVPYEGGKGYIKHYMVNLIEPKAGAPALKEAYKIVPSPNLDDSTWARVRESEDDADKSGYDPGGFRAYYFNLAFQYMTKRDAFWAAKILNGFTDEIIAAIVDGAEFSDPRMKKQMIADLIARRDKTVNHWFSKVIPLDNFEIQDGDGFAAVTFDDLLKNGQTTGTEYKYRLSTVKGTAHLTPWISYVPSPLMGEGQGEGGSDHSLLLSPYAIGRMKPNRIYMLKIMVKRPASKWWQGPANIYLKKNQGLEVVGVRR